MDLKAYKCTCCGGKVNPATLTCEYCGMKFYKQDEQIFRLETFQNPVITLGTCVQMPFEALESIPANELNEIALKQMARELSENIIPHLEVEIGENYAKRQIEYRARLRLVHPGHRF